VEINSRFIVFVGSLSQPSWRTKSLRELRQALNLDY